MVTSLFNITKQKLLKTGGETQQPMPTLNVLLLTGRTLRQGQGKEYGKLSDKYWKNVAICEIDPEDLKKLDIKESQPVKITTDHGSIEVRAIKSLRGPHPGRIFIPYGPWASIIVNPETNSTGMPSFKGIPATIEPAPTGDKVMTLPELLQKHYRKE